MTDLDTPLHARPGHLAVLHTIRLAVAGWKAAIRHHLVAVEAAQDRRAAALRLRREGEGAADAQTWQADLPFFMQGGAHRD
jgi:hypothetical protein